MGVPSALNIITASWSGAADADSGLAGYSVLFDDQPTTQPDDVVDVPHTTDPHSVMSAALADGMWYFHLSACDVAGNCSVATHLGPFVIDTTMPSLTAYDTVADTGDGSLSANEVTSSPITQVLVSFNEDLDTATAQNLGNWGLISAGANGTIDSSACAVSGDDVNVGATAATLLGDLQTVRLDVGGGSSLAGDLYRLSACSGITDLAGNALANSTIDFTVAVDNLIPNPNFDDELAPWIAGGTRPQDLAWGGVDAEGKATSGALEVSTTSGTSATTSAEVCVDVPAGMPTLLAGSLEVLDGSGGDPVVTLELIASDMPGCATASATSGAVTIASGPTAGQDFVVRAPAGTWTSVLARFTVTGGASSTHTVRIDVLEGLLFADGFECGPGSICQWSSEVP